MTDFNPQLRDPRDFEPTHFEYQLRRMPFKPGIVDRVRLFLAPAALIDVYILGIDISHWNYTPDFEALKAGGYEYVIMKASQGDNWPDPKFTEYWPKVLDAGLVPGAYHMFDGRYSGADQADFHLNTIAGMVAASQGEYIRSQLDVELNDGATVVQRQNRGIAFMQTVKDEQGRAGAYSNKSKWQELMGNLRLIDPRDGVEFDGWNALWTPKEMIIYPTGWTLEQIKLWQFGHSGYSWVDQPPGTRGSVDVNRFLGTLAEFKA